jgi:hypothetical protein
MYKYSLLTFLLLIMIITISCNNKTKEELIKVRNSTIIDKSKLKTGFDKNVLQNFTK